MSVTPLSLSFDAVEAHIRNLRPLNTMQIERHLHILAKFRKSVEADLSATVTEPHALYGHDWLRDMRRARNYQAD